MALCASHGNRVSSAATPSPSPVSRRLRVTRSQYRRAGAEDRRFVDAPRIARREALRRLGVGHRADDGEAQPGRLAGQHRDMGAAARPAVGIEQLVAADRLDGIRRVDDQMVHGVGIALSPKRCRVRAEGDAQPLGVDLDAARVAQLPLAEDEPGEDEEAAGRRRRP